MPAELTSGGYIGGRREKTGKERLIKREKGRREKTGKGRLIKREKMETGREKRRDVGGEELRKEEKGVEKRGEGS
ncbi:MAG: hypothetical protein II970_05315 [Paludibacteraceae bacterium]|nr:hypothetical protein [Paludibacteraceae bacterium]